MLSAAGRHTEKKWGSEMQAGEKWNGWNVVRVIGRGSFGSVYEIHRDVFGTVEKAALKQIIIPQDDSETDELLSEGYDLESISRRYSGYLQDIVKEYTLMLSLKGGANIVSCDDLDYHPRRDGIGWELLIRMELLTPLLNVLDASDPAGQAVQVGRDICGALAQCEEQHIIHRDIKPQNILLSPRGQYKLGDFGVAKVASRTTVGTRTGTFRYMAPEVYSSQPYGTAADIYSLGMVMYWLLNRRRSPFVPLPPEESTYRQDEDAQTRRIRGEPLPPPADGSDRLKRIVLKACAFDPRDRYRNAREMLADLEALEEGEQEQPERPERKKRPRPQSLRESPPRQERRERQERPEQGEQQEEPEQHEKQERPPRSPQPDQPVPQEPPRPRKRSRVFLWIGIAVLLIADIILIVRLHAYKPETSGGSQQAGTAPVAIPAAAVVVPTAAAVVSTASELEPFVIYISGIDSRDGMVPECRSDANIIATVNPQTRQVLLVSTPRDYYIPLSVSNGELDKLTHAGLYGVNVSVETLEMLYGIDIDYYFRVDFVGFEDIIDALGGVTVDSDAQFWDCTYTYYFDEGPNELNGEEALAFVRERKAFEDGDRARGRHQMVLIKAIADKILSTDLLKNYASVWDAVSTRFETSMSYDMVTALVQDQLTNGGSWNIQSYSVDGTENWEGICYSLPDTPCYVLEPDQATVDTAASLMESVLAGEIVYSSFS